jgi:hypothetical protein
MASSRPMLKNIFRSPDLSLVPAGESKVVFLPIAIPAKRGQPNSHKNRPKLLLVLNFTPRVSRDETLSGFIGFLSNCTIIISPRRGGFIANP